MFGIVRTIVNIVVGIIEFLLSLRFVFKFFVVNAGTPFVAWLYSVTAPLVSPFAGIAPSLKLGRFVVDFSTLVALVVYVLVGYLILQIFYQIEPRYYGAG
ncbi:MAG: hypothetical protein CO141_01270 [Candidatus Moranbacteria bacterium CG_4_9_14_3_um_filter_42_9]|nr:MAG: hypothetical protein CO141_01270 [Candidatus Moranbacteria bacterium CG_4_9_14_3_um_filter_42_9]